MQYVRYVLYSPLHSLSDTARRRSVPFSGWATEWTSERTAPVEPPPLPSPPLRKPLFSLPINSRSRIRQSDRSDDQGRKLPHEWGNPRSPETRHFCTQGSLLMWILPDQSFRVKTRRHHLRFLEVFGWRGQFSSLLVLLLPEPIQGPTKPPMMLSGQDFPQMTTSHLLSHFLSSHFSSASIHSSTDSIT